MVMNVGNLLHIEKLVFQYYFMHLQPQHPGASVINLKNWSAL